MIFGNVDAAPGKPPRPPKHKPLKDKADEPEIPKPTEGPSTLVVPQKEHEVQIVPDVQEPAVVLPDVQVLSFISVELEDIPTLQWDEAEPDIYEDPNPAKDPVEETPVNDTAKDKSKVPRVLRSHDSKKKDEHNEKYMVSVFMRGKERALLRGDDAKKAAALSRPKYVWTDDCPENFELGKAFLSDWALDEVPWEMRRFHTWYMEASKKDQPNLTIQSLANAFAGEGFFWLDFNDLHAIYCHVPK